MKLFKARVQNYRSVRDTGEFAVEDVKTILVGPNEAGKTAVLQALQRLKPPSDLKPLNALRDYPRALYNDIATGKVKPSNVVVATGWFSLDADDLKELPPSHNPAGTEFVVSRHLDNSLRYHCTSAPEYPWFRIFRSDLLRLVAHMDRNDAAKSASASLSAIIGDWNDSTAVTGKFATGLTSWLDANIALVDEDNDKEMSRYDELLAKVKLWGVYDAACGRLYQRVPKFILFSNIFRVRPNIHLEHLAIRLENNALDDDHYDYGNSCLLKLLGFTARQLSDLGKVAAPDAGDQAAMERFRDQLDTRNYQLNAASVRLSREIKEIWNPDEGRGEASKLRLVADGQYLKVVVEDSVGVEVELDQRSEGFQWLVSFFVVFFSEAEGEHANSILLLDEPGVSLHAIKQRDFRNTISKLAAKNPTIYTTHSPFLVGPDELDIVRVVEMTDREVGTKVHTSITSNDPAALLPLQEALGYDLAQSLFATQRNLICEGLTDYWYVDATSQMFIGGGLTGLNDKIAIVPSSTASKVVYFATILTAHNLKVAALLDSDNAGDQAAKQELLVHRLGAKRIIRTADFTDPAIPKAEIEDLLKDTLIPLAASEFGVDVSTEAAASPTTPITDLLLAKGGSSFSKYKLAKAYIRWTRDHKAADLSTAERAGWTKLLAAINSALK
ncbi:OLD family endonuclease [Rhizobium leguminosarum bv. viciae]|uniref:AAA family ATPase n=1 Tax=Rhizobium leguminosarum TaxID=384 RepID=UPI000B928479|nr:AAA family ATPase [Rhizobium leguminosarum]ASS53264.1 OLD family endonuclease [Rhizobium leguminosarum bv. viciae]TBZ35093.1 OLD family endonuclease [Rhizobium leguminosarum bv. viciae]